MPHKYKRDLIACRRLYAKSHATELHEYNRRYRLRRIVLVNRLKNKPCMDCHGWFEPCQMDWDHRGQKSFGIAYSKTITLERLLKEIAKCGLVCANCHRLRTKQRGQYGIQGSIVGRSHSNIL